MKHNGRIKEPIIKNKLESLPVNTNQNSRILFRFLNCSSYSMTYVFNRYNKNYNEYRKFVKLLEKFIYDFTNMKYQDARKAYSSHKSGGRIDTNNTKLKNIIKYLPDNVIDMLDLDSDLLTHYHLKRNGQGKELIFGIESGSDFYVIALDPFHELI